MTSNSMTVTDPAHFDNPFPVYKTLREQAPVYFEPTMGFHIVTGYQNVKKLLTHSGVSSNRQAMLQELEGKLKPGSIETYMENAKVSMIQLDPPEHTRLRALASSFFHKGTVQEWVPVMEANFHRLIKNEKQKGRLNLGNVARHYPADVICDIFGMPHYCRESYIKNAGKVAKLFGAPIDNELQTVASEANQASIDNARLIAGFIEERVDKPCNDLLGHMAKSYGDGELTMRETTTLCGLLLTAGHITTTELLCNGVYQLLSHPEQWVWLQKNPERVPDAIEEIMRFDTSVPFTIRVIKEKISLDGGDLEPGDVVAVGLSAANHDPEFCERPDEFDITRGRTRHLAFAAGPHVCLGALMAREELRVALDHLLKSCPDLRFDPDNLPQRRCDSLMFRGFKTFHLQY
ncbi:cytochrome P450 [Endozoicomonas sp. Mp262]|uniref:cytochrome P450 n=1 Tax=Endozoicomonas sp. Mp262 TaxID=2919499 RepID=UPI0021DB2C7C